MEFIKMIKIQKYKDCNSKNENISYFSKKLIEFIFNNVIYDSFYKVYILHKFSPMSKINCRILSSAKADDN